MRPSDVQVSINTLAGWERVFRSGKPISRKQKTAWATQASFIRELLERTFPETVDVWRWPVVGGVQQLSISGGEVQDSAAHARRGVGPAVDLPGLDGTPLQPFIDIPVAATGYDGENGYWALWSWDGFRGLWQARYSHLPAEGELVIGRTGNTEGNHVHVVLWLNGVRVDPMQQTEFRVLATG